MRAASAAAGCCCAPPDPLRLWCAACGGLLPDDAAGAAADEPQRAIDLYEAVLADLDRLGAGGAGDERLAGVRAFYEQQLAARRATTRSAAPAWRRSWPRRGG